MEIVVERTSNVSGLEVLLIVNTICSHSHIRGTLGMSLRMFSMFVKEKYGEGTLM